jgi:hypothetical protein
LLVSRPATRGTAIHAGLRTASAADAGATGAAEATNGAGSLVGGVDGAGAAAGGLPCADTPHPQSAAATRSDRPAPCDRSHFTVIPMRIGG